MNGKWSGGSNFRGVRRHAKCSYGKVGEGSVKLREEAKVVERWMEWES